MSEPTRPGQTGTATSNETVTRPRAGAASATPPAAPSAGSNGFDPDKTMLNQVPEGIYGSVRPGSAPGASGPSAAAPATAATGASPSAPTSGPMTPTSGPTAPSTPNPVLPGAAGTAAAATTAGAAAGPAKKPKVSRRTRKARLRLSRIDPWSVMKTSLLFGIAGGIIFFVAIWVLWGVLGTSGVFESVNKAVNDLVATPGAEAKFRLEDYINTDKVLGFSAMIAAADVVIFTALATLFSFLYNLSATVLGGLEVTLAED